MVTNLIKVYSEVFDLFKSLIISHHVTDSQLIVELSIIPSCDLLALSQLCKSLNERGFGFFLSDYNSHLAIVVYDSLTDSSL